MRALLPLLLAAGLRAEDGVPGAPSDLVLPRRQPVTAGGYAILTGGSTWRSDHGLLRRREDGNLIDGGVGAWFGGAERFVALGGGTDPDAAEAGRLIVEGTAYRAWRMAGWAVGTATAHAGYSDERQWIFDGDMLLGPLHLAAGREDTAKAYRFGLGLDGRWSDVGLHLAADRIVIYADDLDRRRLATEVTASVTVGVLRGVGLELEGGVAHSALGAPTGEDTWRGALAVIVCM